MASTPYQPTFTEYGQQVTSPAQIGTSATDLVGFYGATPVAQRSGAVQAILSTYAPVSYGPVYGFATEAYAAAVYTLVNEIYSTLTALGLWKGGA